MQIALTSNHILLTYIAYLVSFVSYQYLKRSLVAIKKRYTCSPCFPNERQKWRLLPSAPLSGVPDFKTYILFVRFKKTYSYSSWKEEGKWNKIAVLPRDHVQVLQILEVLSKSFLKRASDSCS